MHSFVYQNVMQKMQKIPAGTSKRLHLLGLQDFGRMQGILEKHGGNHAECVDGHFFVGQDFLHATYSQPAFCRLHTLFLLTYIRQFFVIRFVKGCFAAKYTFLC